MTEEVKRPVGRPSLYDPAYCDQVIELGNQGKSIEQIAAKLGVSTRVIFDWKDKHPEFLHALDQAKELELDWWENIAQNMMVEHKDGSKLNSSLVQVNGCTIPKEVSGKHKDRNHGRERRTAAPGNPGHICKAE